MSLISGSNSRTVVVAGAPDLRAAMVVKEFRVEYGFREAECWEK